MLRYVVFADSCGDSPNAYHQNKISYILLLYDLSGPEDYANVWVGHMNLLKRAGLIRAPTMWSLGLFRFFEHPAHAGQTTPKNENQDIVSERSPAETTVTQGLS